MPLEKHNLLKNKKNYWLNFWKEYINYDFIKTVFIDETLFRVEKKTKQRKWRKIGEKYEI